MRSTRQWRRGLSFSIVAGIVVTLAFALLVHIWGARTLAWPGFRFLLVFIYPFATVPINTSAYGIFALTVVLNACYYACLALLGIFVRRRVASVFFVAIVMLLIALVAGPVLHVAFHDFETIDIR